MVKVTREKIENSQAFLKVEMEPADMEAPLEDSYRRLAKKANIPGFRKGKAPRTVLERHIGKEHILEEALRQLVPQAYEQALKEQEIEPFAQPDIEITQTDPVVFTAVVPLTPVVELGDYRNVQLAPDPVEVTEENTNAVLESLRHQHATWEPVERPLDFNDLAVIDINSEVDEKPFIKKLGVQYQVLRDSVAPAPGFAEQIIGMSKEEEKEFKLNLPDDYPQSEFAGKEASFKVKLSEIKEEILPELNDELAGQVSPDFKTVDSLREGVSSSLKQGAEERAIADFEERVINTVVEQAQVDYPPVLVDMEINRLLNDSARQFQMRGRSLDEYLKTVNKTEEELREEFRPVATRNVASSLVIGKVADEEKIEAGDAEVDAEIERMTTGAADDKKEELRKMMDTPQTRESIKRSLITRKTIERLVEIAKSTGETKTEAKEAKNEQST
jgi:trigger factor